MGLLDKFIKKYWGIFKLQLKYYLDFIKDPMLYKMIIKGALKLLQKFKDNLLNILLGLIGHFLFSGKDPLINKLFNDKSEVVDSPEFDYKVKTYVYLHPGTKAILQLADYQLDDDVLDDINKRCIIAEYDNFEELNDLSKELKDNLGNIDKKELNEDNIINKFNTNNDFDKKIDDIAKANKSTLDRIMDMFNSIMPYLFLMIYLINVIKEYLEQNDRPSHFRGKYITKMLRTIGALFKSLFNDMKNTIKNEAKQFKKEDEKLQEEANKKKDELKSIYSNRQTYIQNFKKGFSEEEQALLKEFKGIVKSLDKIIFAVILGTLLYELNRLLLKTKSYEDVNKLFKDLDCNNNNIQINEPSYDNPYVNDKEIKIEPLKLNYDEFNFDICNVDDKDNIIVPHTPFEIKAENVDSCELPQDNLVEYDNLNLPDPKFKPDLITRAIYGYLGNNKVWNPIVKKDDIVEYNTLLVQIGNDNIKSNIVGIVDIIDYNRKEIIIKNFIEPNTNILDESLKELQNLYQRNTNIKEFIKNFYIKLSLPVYLQSTKYIRTKLKLDTSDMHIKYIAGGVEKKYKKAKKKEKRLKKKYNKSLKKIADVDNVEYYAKREEMHKIKEQIDKEDNKYLKNLKSIFNEYLDRSKKTKSKAKEFVLIDWYLSMYDELVTFMDDSEDPYNKIQNKDSIKNEILQEFIKLFNKLIIKRILIDKFDIKDLQGKINDIGEELDNKVTVSSGDYYSKLLDVYEKEKKKESKSQTDKSTNIKDLSKYLQTSKNIKDAISNKLNEYGLYNEEDDDQEKNELKQRMYSLFILSTKIEQIKKDLTDLTEQQKEDLELYDNKYQATWNEANKIKGLLNDIWKELAEFDDNTKKLLDTIEELENHVISHTTIIRNGEEFRYYGITDEKICLPQGFPKYGILPYTENDIWSPMYWLRYCGFATLGSVMLPPNWSTGFLPPFGPMPFPTVYIPIKPFKTDWGVILLGLSITGIYIFPFLHIANLSVEPHIPFIDPVSILRKEINQLKIEVLKLKKELEEYTISIPLKKYEEDIEKYTKLIAETNIKIVEARSDKPRLDRKKALKDKIKAQYEFAQEELEYKEKIGSLYEQKITYNIKKFEAEVKWWVLYKALNGQDMGDELKYQDKLIQTFKKADDKINKFFDNLEKQVAQINPIIAAIPLSTKPGTANFSYTLKNPKPIAEFDNKVIENINDPLVNKITKPFQLKRADLMMTAYETVLNKSIININPVFAALSAANLAIIPKEPYPVYEKLVPWNLPWTAKFIMPQWVPAGAKQFGFPGFPQFPTPV